LRPFHSNQSDTLLDLSVDETFGNNKEIYKLAGLIPYTKNWYGFIHTEVKICQELELSLKYCKGLFVFSEHQKQRIMDILAQNQVPTPFQVPTSFKINVLYFPVSEPGKTWNLKLFRKNLKVVHFSTKHEDTFSFYRTSFEINYGSKIANYFADYFKIGYSVPFVKLLINEVNNQVNNQLPEEETISLINSVLTDNTWNQGLLKHINEMIKSVKVIKKKDLDKLLSQNIVYIRRDCNSVCVILNECIVRNTPMIINRSPSALELLGEDYPLYYDDDLPQVVINISKIIKAHKYLIKLNKTRLKNRLVSNSFICKLNELAGS
jgi:hypothetical protein